MDTPCPTGSCRGPASRDHLSLCAVCDAAVDAAYAMATRAHEAPDAPFAPPVEPEGGGHTLLCRESSSGYDVGPDGREAFDCRCGIGYFPGEAP